MLLTDRQTKRQTYRHRRNHNLLGGGNDDYLLRRHSTAARILRSLSQCVWGCVGVYLCVLVRWNENPWSEWPETWHRSSPRRSVEAHWFWIQKVKGQGHKVIISKFWHPLHIRGTDAGTKFKFCAQMHYERLLSADQKLCRNAAAVTEYNSLWKLHPHWHNALSNEHVQWYFRDISYNGWPVVWCHPVQLCLSSRHDLYLCRVHIL